MEIRKIDIYNVGNNQKQKQLESNEAESLFSKDYTEK
jgi:hypothetical protein